MSLHKLAGISPSHPGSLSCLLYFLCMLVIPIFPLFKCENFLLYLYIYIYIYTYMFVHVLACSTIARAFASPLILWRKQQIKVMLVLLSPLNLIRNRAYIFLKSCFLKEMCDSFSLPTPCMVGRFSLPSMACRCSVDRLHNGHHTDFHSTHFDA